MAPDTTHHARPTIPPREELAGLPPDGGPRWNRLVFEQSPYLLQHAANPVDWYPWGEEAFRAAREQDKPVFLSVGYSTCHWCHVMERESFEDGEVAALLNRDFIAVKVDREERPDVDHVYMTVTQALTGSGGWPMTVFLTPDKRPFYAGTYFPKHGAYGRAGMMELLPAVARHWRENRESVFQSAGEITEAVAQLGGGAPGETLDAGALALGRQQLAARYDDGHGGFGSAPKFPTPHALSFLLRWWRRTGDGEALAMVEKTLDEMRRGGIYDHVGFGFHRYSTDARWLVPHFEKMLYDQALHAIACTEAYQATGKQDYADTAREVLTYVLRDMTAPEGGFYSAEDADSEGEEGKFYVWTTEELRRVLGEEESRLFIDAFRLADEGNFLEESTRRLTGANIPHRVQSPARIARERNLAEAELRRRLEAAREKLFAVRERRVHPYKDDKILTDWNGLMIAALALASRALGEPAYATAAGRAADFVLSTLRGADGRLVKRYRNGEAGLPAHLDDYAFLAWGLLELYETTFEPRYLREALATTDQMLERFWDETGEALFMTPDDGEPLLVRSKEVYDGAIPSGNSVAASNLLRLAHLTGNMTYARRADAILSAFSDTVTRAPSGFCQLLIAVDFAVGPSLELVIAGRPDAPDTRAMLAAVRELFAPGKVVLFRPDGEEDPEIARLAPYTATQRALNGAATAYICRNFACNAPTTDPEAVRAALRGATEEH